MGITLVDPVAPKLYAAGLTILVLIILGWGYVLYQTYKDYPTIIKAEYERRMKVWKKRLGVK